jgi:hypothetical protein
VHRTNMSRLRTVGVLYIVFGFSIYLNQGLIAIASAVAASFVFLLRACGIQNVIANLLFAPILLLSTNIFLGSITSILNIPLFVDEFAWIYFSSPFILLLTQLKVTQINKPKSPASRDGFRLESVKHFAPALGLLPLLILVIKNLRFPQIVSAMLEGPDRIWGHLSITDFLLRENVGLLYVVNDHGFQPKGLHFAIASALKIAGWDSFDGQEKIRFILEYFLAFELSIWLLVTLSACLLFKNFSTSKKSYLTNFGFVLIGILLITDYYFSYVFRYGFTTKMFGAYLLICSVLAINLQKYRVIILLSLTTLLLNSWSLLAIAPFTILAVLIFREKLSLKTPQAAGCAIYALVTNYPLARNVFIGTYQVFNSCKSNPECQGKNLGLQILASPGGTDPISLLILVVSLAYSTKILLSSNIFRFVSIRGAFALSVFSLVGVHLLLGFSTRTIGTEASYYPKNVLWFISVLGVPVISALFIDKLSEFLSPLSKKYNGYQKTLDLIVVVIVSSIAISTLSNNSRSIRYLGNSEPWQINVYNDLITEKSNGSDPALYWYGGWEQWGGTILLTIAGHSTPLKDSVLGDDFKSICYFIRDRPFYSEGNYVALSQGKNLQRKDPRPLRIITDKDDVPASISRDCGDEVKLGRDYTLDLIER